MVFLIILVIIAISGRVICSSLCPVGIIQELLYKIPFVKKFKKFKYDMYLQKIKYLIFILLIILIPLVFIPNKDNWKTGMLILKISLFSLVFILSVIIYRPFCKYFCPFAIVLGAGNKISAYRFEVEDNCNKCGFCSKNCDMNIIPFENPNSLECIRCNKCINKCPKKAIHVKEYKKKAE